MEPFNNFYEHLVLDHLEEVLQQKNKQVDEDYVADVACVALNQLPPRYIRYSIDASFYITSAEREQMERAVTKAVKEAIEFIDHRRNQHPDGTCPKKPV